MKTCFDCKHTAPEEEFLLFPDDDVAICTDPVLCDARRAQHKHQTEMAFTPWNEACRDKHVDADRVTRQCRRPVGHSGPHASDLPYLEWVTTL